MPVVGTAGHVDHGKSTLVQALTGRDPDRWEEEKRRGVTIDLGFAWTDIGGRQVSFVDVPGHERYLKNMLAGIDPIDVALFVVAADEGWMPQSEEHLAVLDLLGIDRGVVALTKTDIVDRDTVEIAILEIEDNLEGTTLAGSSIVPVSAATGSGLAGLTAILTDLLPDDSDPGMRPRLWIDRSFSVAGAGTVVTGTLVGGSIGLGDGMTVLPGDHRVRIRSMQSHEQEVTSARPGRRLALGLTGVDRQEVPRGSMLGLEGQWELTKRFTAAIRTARYVDALATRGAFHMHVGSGAHKAVISRMKDGVAFLQLTEPLPLCAGDRFIIRDTGRKLVAAGGVVLDPAPGRQRAAVSTSARIPVDSTPNAIADSLLAIRGTDSVARLAAHSGGGYPAAAVIVGDTAFSRGALESLRARAFERVSSDHEAHPLRQGMPMATLATALGVEADVAELVVLEEERLETVGPDVRLVGHSAGLGPADEAAWARAEEMLAAGLDVPRETELGVGREVIHLKIREGRLVRIDDGLVVLAEQAEQIRDQIRQMPDGFTVAQFRDATGLSRKYAVPILEWSDREALTIRRGDGRHVR